MKVKTEELNGPALDWAVAKCAEWPMDVWYDEDELPMIRDDEVPEWEPSVNWAQGGPIIERGRITVRPSASTKDWTAVMCDFYQRPAWYGEGSTPLIAAMRAYAASVLGDEVEVPDELFSFA